MEEEEASVGDALEEELPFALASSATSDEFSLSSIPSLLSPTPPTSFPAKYSATPPLTASITSSPSANSLLSSSLIADSRVLDAAASLLFPSLPTNTDGSPSDNFSLHMRYSGGAAASSSLLSMPSSSSAPQNSYTSRGPAHHDSQFSQLLQQASADAPLPILPEEEDTAALDIMYSTPDDSFQPATYASPTNSRNSLPTNPQTMSSGGGRGGGSTSHASFVSANAWGSQDPTVGSASQTFGLSQTIIPATAPTERKLAVLAGATARKTSDRAFCVEIEVSVGGTPDFSSSSSSSLAATRMARVMEILRRPESLPLWCDAVADLPLVVTQQSRREGAVLESDRQYDGEWVLATTTAALRPPSNTSCWYGSRQALATTLGFPTYGKIAVFAEPVRGHVSLTMGPFPGHIQISHRLQVEPVVGTHKLRIIDQVQLQCSDDVTSDPLCGDWWMAVEKLLFLPSVDDYMDQVLSSLARLRFLVKRGESLAVSAASPRVPLPNNPMFTAAAKEGLREPLLS
jgi:hypothetical protein